MQTLTIWSVEMLLFILQFNIIILKKSVFISSACCRAACRFVDHRRCSWAFVGPQSYRHLSTLNRITTRLWQGARILDSASVGVRLSTERRLGRWSIKRLLTLTPSFSYTAARFCRMIVSINACFHRISREWVRVRVSGIAVTLSQRVQEIILPPHVTGIITKQITVKTKSYARACVRNVWIRGSKFFMPLGSI